MCFAPSGVFDVELRDAVQNAVGIVESGSDQCLSIVSNGFGVPNMTAGSKMKVR